MWGIIQVIVAVLVLIEGYFVAKDKIELSKTTIVLHCIVIAMCFFSGALRCF